MSRASQEGEGLFGGYCPFFHFTRITSTHVLVLLNKVMVSKSWNEIQDTLIVEKI